MTDADRHARAVALFLDALERTPETRESWLAEASPDETLRADALALLRAHDQTAAFLDEPLLSRPGETDAEPHVHGRMVGPWRIVERLGQGGMGVVYRAERGDGLYDRAVALKLLAPGALLASGEALARRLAAERRILARLEHDGIARLYDGGVTADGLPYLALELVDGEPITDYAEARGLSTAERVALFARVCDAVAYAHRALVVHRDLKPAHILVAGAEAGREPAVKLLDFGVSALLSDAAGDDGLTKMTVPRALTPAYAAPEQVRGEAVTTAADVYALGVVLYELLAGQRPYDLAGKTAREAERLVVEVPPPSPSAVAPAERRRALRGDLDTIVMKALAKEPDRRYASVGDLAADLRRHLNGVPVEARPATVGYRMRRFVRRHRLGVAAAAAIALILLAGLAGTIWQARAARAEAARAEAVNAFLVDLFDAPSPYADGRDVRVASLLDRAAAALDSAARPPDIEATLRHTLGTTYRSLGLYPEAETQLRRALALRTRLVGPHHPDVAEVQASLGWLLTDRGEYAAADSILTLALTTYRRRFGDRSAQVSQVLNDLGRLRSETGDYDGAVRLWRAAFAIDEATRPPDDLELLVGMANLAIGLADVGEMEEATQLLERQLAALRRYHPNRDVSLANTLANLGSFYYEAGRRDEAAALQREAVERFRRAHGDHHPDVAFGMNNLDSTLGALERHDEAEPFLREAVAIYGTAFGEEYADHPDIGFPLVNLARTLQAQGRLAEAEETVRRALAVFRASFGDESPFTARARAALGLIVLDAGRTDEAIALHREVVVLRDAALPEGHPDRAAARSLLGAALHRAGRHAEAEPLLAASYEALRESLGAEHVHVREARERLRACLLATGRTAEAATLTTP